jgi:hypothetical protein
MAGADLEKQATGDQIPSYVVFHGNLNCGQTRRQKATNATTPPVARSELPASSPEPQ